MVGPAHDRYHPRMIASELRPRCLRGLVLLVVLTVVAAVGQAAAAPRERAAAARPVTIRITWGGGRARAWSGTIRLDRPAGATAAAEPLEWRSLCGEVDAAAAAHAAGPTIFVHEPRPCGLNGVDLVVPQWAGSRLVVRLAATGDETAAVSFDAAIADVLVAVRQQPLDRDGNRLVLKAAPGDALRVELLPSAGAGERPVSAVFRPGETVRLAVEPLLPKRSATAAAIELRARLRASGETEDLATQSVVLAARPADAESDPRLESYERAEFEVRLPAREAAYDVELEVVERGGLRWSRPLAARTVQVVAVAEVADPPAGDPEWRLVYELDPGSPRLHERLRRLPGMSLPKGSIPSMPIPSMPIPSMPLPSMTLPNVAVPNVPLPNVPLPKLPAMPSVSAMTSMVPRLSGLLATGHSTVEAHALGPMLRLPAARAADEPTWEGIVIAGAQPGMPHLVEVAFPLDQRAVVGLCVLEADAGGAVVEARGCSGFEVAPPVDGLPPAELGRHAFVFWPTTRNPLLLVANPATDATALFGRVRVSAGPTRPPRGDGDGSAEAGASGRRVHAFMDRPDFTRFGGAARAAAGSGRSFADWNTFLAGGRHAVEWLAAQSAAGAMVVAYRDGAAIWPSRHTLGGPRWDSGATSDAGLDPAPKDLLGLLCRLHARERLRLVPAVSFDAALPAVEAILAGGGPAATGLVCVGRDGQPRRTVRGSWHYNILDPRVQEAVGDLVDELAGRLAGADAVDGIGVVLPHDGWLHLPGTAWGLDDTTFTRFATAVGGVDPGSGDDRHARRAEAVAGPLHEVWLDWRAAEVARLHARLAATIAARDPRFTLFVAPTTLFAAGELAGRFRPHLASRDADTDVLREIGLDPARLTADRRVVYLSTHVHAAAAGLIDRGIVERSNRSLALARGAVGAARRGLVAVEQPLRLTIDDVVPHGPFGNAAAGAAVPIQAVVVGAGRGRPLAEALAVSDVEHVFDAALFSGVVDAAHARRLRAFAALPAGAFELADPLPAPLVVRSRRDAGRTVVSIANAGPVACRATLALAESPAAVVDAVDAARLPFDPGGGATVALEPFQLRTLLLDGGGAVRGVGVAFDDEVRRSVAARLADLGRRRAVLETPQPLDVLDNPGFELAAAAGGDSGQSAGVGGWELVEPRRGTLALVPGIDAPSGRGLAFASANGLSTLRSNPFPAPPTGRVSVAVWLRIEEGQPQPPLRLALEGTLEDREYYRFATVGGLSGGKPLTGGWSQYVLQVDDLPAQGLESLRVRFDLLGPGAVQIDGVRVFDLAFDEQQRVQLSRRLTAIDERLQAGDLGACVVELDSYWPRFLATFVSDDAVTEAERARLRTAAEPRPVAGAPAERSGSLLDRVRGWWQ